MNIKKGFIRVWTVVSILWIVVFFTFVAYEDEISTILDSLVPILAIAFLPVIILWAMFFCMSQHMTKKVKVLWTGIAIIVLMSLFPPWKDVRSSRPRGSHYVVAGGYGFLFDPPYSAKSIDVGRLGLQIFIVALITGGVIVSIKKK
ncbi:MAG: hypothetical protein CMQ15_17550 [Gammaproteobacteria bacterium]|nr:hypothetical protein [Gammaproteobacteria bacterium]|tara:strand:+ start:3961 stop:4398 length:438 start_codon:yes stop_codon:yes gene_type:complete